MPDIPLSVHRSASAFWHSGKMLTSPQGIHYLSLDFQDRLLGKHPIKTILNDVVDKVYNGTKMLFSRYG